MDILKANLQAMSISDEIENPKDAALLPNLEGILEKKGDVGILKGWRKRYFVLKQDRMIYYKDRDDKLRDKIIGFITLPGCAVEYSVFNHGKGSFQVLTHGRVWHLRAASTEEMEKWMSAIREHAKYKEPTISDVSFSRNALKVKEGFLDQFKKGIADNTWTERWFELRDGILYSYKSKLDQKGAKKYPLYKSNVDEYLPTTETDTHYITAFKLVLQNDKTIILRAPTVDEMHEWLNMIVQHRSVTEQIIGNQH